MNKILSDEDMNEEKRKAEEEKKRKVKCEELIQEAYQYFDPSDD